MRLWLLAATSVFTIQMPSPASAQSAPGESSRGLWVGQVTVSAVNEVVVGVNEERQLVAPDPKVPTPTADDAHIRVILHVNGAGQVSFLKGVAIFDRSDSVDRTDIALVTDESLFPEMPKVGKRIATAAFDFGDPRAVGAVQELVEAAATAAADSINSESSVKATDIGIRSAAQTAATAAAETVIEEADVNKAYLAFIAAEYSAALSPAADAAGVAAAGAFPATESQIRSAALAAANGTGEIISARTAAADLESGSFFADARGTEAVDALVQAVASAATEAIVVAASADEVAAKAAANGAAIDAGNAVGDVSGAFNNFIGGSVFSAMIPAVAEASASAAFAHVEGGGIKPEPAARTAAEGDPAYVAALDAANLLDANAEFAGDSRARDAVNSVKEAAVLAAATSATNGDRASDVDSAALSAAQSAADSVPRVPVPTTAPSAGYRSLIASDEFTKEAAGKAGIAAGEAAFLKAVDGGSDADVREAALIAAEGALRSLSLQAGAVPFGDVLMSGSLGPGGSANCTLILPQDHPTNPFRHRRNPDHADGFEITRHLKFTFDGGPGEALPLAGFGVNRLTGVYEEELFGLHKPLGPDKNVGLRVKGTFELNRISLVGALNVK
jgi:hypothetical protein